MTADKNPLEDAVEQALDAFVYAPIGLLFDGPARFPKLVRNGRNQVTNARMMGQFAVQMGRSEVEKLAAGADGPVVDLLRGLGIVPPAVAPAPTPTEASAAAAEAAPAPSPAAPVKPAKKAAKKAAAAVTKATSEAATNRSAAKKAAAKRPAAVDAATPAVSILPIADYDSLSASQVVTRLRGLSAGQLEAIRAYESATRGRKTILNRVQQLAKA